MLGIALAGCAAAQDRPANGKPNGPGTRRPLDGPRPADGNPPRPDRPGDFQGPLPGLGGPGPFRPQPEDLGPVRPGEEQALLDFARDNLPRVSRALTNLRSRNPQGFRERL